MMQKAWSSTEEVPYCFAKSSVKLQGHMGQKIVDFDPNWTFPDCTSSLNSPIPMKCCTKLEVALERCPIVFQGHPSNFKVTRDADCDPNWAFPDCNSNLDSLMPLKSCTKLKVAWERCICLSRPYVKFQGHTGRKIVDFHPNGAFPDCNWSLNS